MGGRGEGGVEVGVIGAAWQGLGVVEEGRVLVGESGVGALVEGDDGLAVDAVVSGAVVVATEKLHLQSLLLGLLLHFVDFLTDPSQLLFEAGHLVRVIVELLTRITRNQLFHFRQVSFEILSPHYHFRPASLHHLQTRLCLC